jgi:outer membrane protein assembly factor BamB
LCDVYGAADNEAEAPLMRTSTRIPLLATGLLVLSAFAPGAQAQEDSGWRISPEKINIRVGEDRRLQLLDDLAQELHDATWSVDYPSFAELREEDGRMVLHALAEGTVRVSARIGEQTRYREIKIWPQYEELPVGTTHWGVHPIGREIKDLPAVPTPSAPHQYSLEQTKDLATYLRANAEDGIQLWTWLVPEKTADVELVCGDWLGGALISANRANSFTLYSVGIDGKVRWQHEVAGIRKGHTISLQHQVFILSQMPDGSAARVTAFDEETGVQQFNLALPTSHEREATIAKDGTQTVCATKTVATFVSHLCGNMDGYTYLAFTNDERTVEVPKCGTEPNSRVYRARADDLIVWQIHPDGTVRSTVAVSNSGAAVVSGVAVTALPTGEILTDGMNGLMMSVRLTQQLNSDGRGQGSDEFVYRLDPEGKVLFQLPLPKYNSALHDGMIIGKDNVGYATRGGALIAFDVNTGKDLWHWESGTQEVSVFVALANGDVLVQTPTALVEVQDATNSKELLQGHFMMDWQGHLYRKHD